MTVKPSRSSVGRISERTTGSSSTTRIDAVTINLVSCIGSSNDLAGDDRMVAAFSEWQRRRRRLLTRLVNLALRGRPLGRALLGFHQHAQVAGSRRHFTFEIGEESFGGQDPIVAGQRFDLLTILRDAAGPPPGGTPLQGVWPPPHRLPIGIAAPPPP